MEPVYRAPDACPLCGAASARMFEAHGHWLRECGSCRHQFCEPPAAGHVERVYGDQYFHGGGDGYTDYLAEEALLRDRGRRYARMLTQWMRPGRTLDAGCAAGFVLRGFVDEGWSGVGIDPNAAMTRHARERLSLDARQGTLETAALDGAFDLVSLIQVIAHFVDPHAAMAAAARVTAPGGYWLIESWNRDSWTRRIFGRNWHEYSPPSVLHWFSPDGLGSAAARHGMTRVASGRPSKWIHSDHAASLVAHKLHGSALGPLGRAITALTPRGIALPYPAEDLFWILLRKSG